jgi:hypothetical protein
MPATVSIQTTSKIRLGIRTYEEHTRKQAPRHRYVSFKFDSPARILISSSVRYASCVVATASKPHQERYQCRTRSTLAVAAFWELRP